jgi:hypothetical protein
MRLFKSLILLVFLLSCQSRQERNQKENIKLLEDNYQSIQKTIHEGDSVLQSLKQRDSIIMSTIKKDTALMNRLENDSK